MSILPFCTFKKYVTSGKYWHKRRHEVVIMLIGFEWFYDLVLVSIVHNAICRAFIDIRHEPTLFVHLQHFFFILIWENIISLGDCKKIIILYSPDPCTVFNPLTAGAE